MTIWTLKPFRKDYAALSNQAQKKVDKALGLMAQDNNHPGLRIHNMANQPDIYEARVDINYRITFQIEDEKIILRRVGTHEIYRKP